MSYSSLRNKTWPDTLVDPCLVSQLMGKNSCKFYIHGKSKKGGGGRDTMCTVLINKSVGTGE
jgi:hypothetical protein